MFIEVSVDGFYVIRYFSGISAWVASCMLTVTVSVSPVPSFLETVTAETSTA